MKSILNSIKKRLGISEEYEHFDDDIIMDINSVFAILNQLGVGPSDGFSIENQDAEWNDFLCVNQKKLELVKSYVYLKVKLLFDPPQSSFVLDSINRQISEFEWRILEETDYNK